MKKFYLFFLLSLFIINSPAQIFTLYGDKAFGGTEDEIQVQIGKLKFNELILAGKILSLDGAKQEILKLVK